MQTSTGRKFNLADPNPQDIDILDIAHHLSQINRYTGAASEPYNVADHSLRVMDLVEAHMPQHALAALLHDAAEALMGDVSSPLKNHPEMRWYKAQEKKLQLMIYEKFGLPPFEPEIVKAADAVLLSTEAHNLLSPLHPDIWEGLPKPMDEFFAPLPPELAERLFLEAFRRLRG